jgi:hypothetical protein
MAMIASPAWLQENQAAILGGWPRIPLPADATHLSHSAQLGARVAALLDTEQSVTGVTTGTLEPLYIAVGKLTRIGGGALSPQELAITEGWGRGGHGAPVMPGSGRLSSRDAYDDGELVALSGAADALGEDSAALIDRLGRPIDVHLNPVAYLKGVPTAVWEFTIGGYQVLKKWLSYREQEVIGGPLRATEVRDATAIVRRLTALVVMQPTLDASYEAIRASAYPWPSLTHPGAETVAPDAMTAE